MAADLPTLSSSHRVLYDGYLMTEIFLRYPAKSLGRFKCVCKRWNSIVSSDPFSRTYALLHRLDSDLNYLADSDHHTNLLSLLSYASPSPFPYQINTPFSPLKLLDSCNGLLLCSVVDAAGQVCYCVYNPTTYQSKTIPARSDYVYDVYLAFEPSRFNSFRIVCLTSHRKIYSIGSLSLSSWEVPRDVVCSRGVYWNGAVNLISLSEDSVYFDIVNEQLGRFASPPISQWTPECYGKLCELNGILHYGYVDVRHSLDYNVYALEGNRENWVLKYKVDASNVGIEERYGLGFSKPCFVVSEEGMGRRLEMVVSVGGEVMAYDLESNTWRKLFENHIRHELPIAWNNACHFTPTLAMF